MSRRAPALLNALFAAALAAAPARAQTTPAQPIPRTDESVELRGSRETLTGQIVDVSAQGVLVRSQDAVGGVLATLISWDCVRAIDGPHAQAIAPFAAFADALWRGAARVERGDFPKAEAVLEPFVKGGSALLIGGPSGQVLTESVMRCRLARGFTSGATWSWLQWSSVHAAGPAAGTTWRGGTLAMPPIIDPVLGLCSQLPPIYSLRTGQRALRAFADSTAWDHWTQPGTPPVAHDFAQLYRWSLQGEIALAAGSTPQAAPLITSTDPAVSFVFDIVTARLGDAQQRIDARARLDRRLKDITAFATQPRPADDAGALDDAQTARRWQEAWCRAAIGRSLLREDDAALRRRGLIELLHVPARFAEVTPSLAALALADVAAELDRAGDHAGAIAVRGDLKGRLAIYLDDESAAEEPAAPAALPAAPVAPATAAAPPSSPAAAPPKPPASPSPST